MHTNLCAEIDMTKLTDAIDGIGKAHEQFVEKANKSLDAMTDRIEGLEANSDRPKGAVHSNGEKYSRDENEHKSVFLNWLRNPRDGSAKRHLDEAQDEINEGKAVTLGSDPGGGFALPAEIANDVEKRVTVLNPFRRICRVTKVGSSDFAHLVSRNQAGSGWVGESATRTETDTSTLIERKPTFGTLYSFPKSSEEAFSDIFFDVQAWLLEEISDGFAAAEATAFVTGNGTNKPTGFLNSAPVATADGASPERDPGTLEYIPMDSASPQALGADDLIDLLASIADQYLADESSVAWVMRRATASLVRKLKSSNGDYYWQPSLQVGEPATLLGFPVLTTNAMPAHLADAHSIAFGNWRRGYLIADRSEIKLTIDDNISTPGFIKFYARKRVGAVILNADAIKVLKLADS